MQQDVNITDGAETPEAGGCCGGGCCGGGEAESTTTGAAEQFLVEGMTCGHCSNAVTQELSALAGVAEVKVDVVAGGRSTVSVTASQPLDREAVRAAIDEAGYTLVD